MALGTGSQCIKYLLFFFNLLFVLCGGVLIIIGAVIEAKYRTYLDFISHEYVSASYTLIVVGCLIFVIGFFGCCGAIKENRCMVVTFSVLLGVVFLVQLGVGVACYVMSGQVEELLHKAMRESMNNYNETRPGVYKSWNILQHDHVCCGTDDWKDWEATPFGEALNGVPDACCKENTLGCGADAFSDPAVAERINQRGCFDLLKDDVKNNINILGGVAIGVGCVQLLGVVFACCLAKSLKRQYETV